MQRALITETELTGWKNGYVQCKCGWRKDLGEGFNGYKIANCPACTPILETRTQRKVIYGTPSNYTADVGVNTYFLLSSGISIRYSFSGTSHTGLSMRRAQNL